MTAEELQEENHALRKRLREVEARLAETETTNATLRDHCNQRWLAKHTLDDVDTDAADEADEAAPVDARCASCDQRLDAEHHRDTYHEALLEHIRDLAAAKARADAADMLVADQHDVTVALKDDRDQLKARIANLETDAARLRGYETSFHRLDGKLTAANERIAQLAAEAEKTARSGHTEPYG